MPGDLARDAIAISGQWRDELALADLLAAALSDVGDDDVDLIALGKAAPEMAAAAGQQLGRRVRRRFVVSDHDGPGGPADGVLLGEHPRPGPGSERAGQALLGFLAGAPAEGVTVFLLSGGASSLCVVAQDGIERDDPSAIFDAALRTGSDISTLNTVRAAASAIAGGLVLRRVRTPRSCTLLMVDNVVSGAPGVASGLTYDVTDDPAVLRDSLAALGLNDTSVGDRITRAAARGAALRAGAPLPDHRNIVIAEPSTMLAAAVDDATRRGYRVVSLGAAVHGDVRAVAAMMTTALRREGGGRPLCVVGAGEVTVAIHGTGQGGRCQEFACTMVEPLSQWPTPVAFVARASDGRDYLDGVAGAWVDRSTRRRGAARGVDWSDALARNDSFHALHTVDQLLPGGPTGWNLCDLYVACAAADDATGELSRRDSDPARW